MRASKAWAGGGGPWNSSSMTPWTKCSSEGSPRRPNVGRWLIPARSGMSRGFINPSSRILLAQAEVTSAAPGRLVSSGRRKWALTRPLLWQALHDSPARAAGPPSNTGERNSARPISVCGVRSRRHSPGAWVRMCARAGEAGVHACSRSKIEVAGGAAAMRKSANAIKAASLLPAPGRRRRRSRRMRGGASFSKPSVSVLSPALDQVRGDPSPGPGRGGGVAVQLLATSIQRASSSRWAQP